MPRQPPHLLSGLAILADRSQRGDACRAGDIQSDHRQVLDVLRQHEGPALQHQDPMPMRYIGAEDVGGDRRAEGPAAENDDVEWPRVVSDAAVGAAHRLVEAVAYITAQYIQ